MEQGYPVLFGRPKGRRCSAPIPKDLPPEMKGALDRSRFCVPAMAPYFPGLLLCDAVQHLEWERAMQAFPNRDTHRIIYLLQATPNDPRHLRLSTEMLRFAGIKGPARLRLLETGILLLQPDNTDTSYEHDQ